MKLRKIIIFLLVFGICSLAVSSWADRDAMIDIDNHSAAFSGTWTTSTNKLLYYGDDYRFTVCNGHDSYYGTITAQAIFNSEAIGIKPDISGVYHVYVRWTAFSNRTDSARYRIYRDSAWIGGCILNQRIRGGEWVFCDEVTLDTGDFAIVRLGDNCESGRVVIADAVRFVRVSKDYNDIVDMPGVDYIAGSQQVVLTTSDQTIRSISLTVPASGHVIVNASGFFCTTAGSDVYAYCSITSGTTTDSVNIWSRFNTGNGCDAFGGTRGFSVTGSGTKTFNLVCRSGSTDPIKIYDTSMTAVYSPKRY